MSLDCMLKRQFITKPDYMTMEQLINMAKRDSDPVSVFAHGSSWNDMDLCVFVVKGKDTAKNFYDYCVATGHVTFGKSVT